MSLMVNNLAMIKLRKQQRCARVMRGLERCNQEALRVGK